jgi:multiple sugar transport system permease protein
MTEPQGRDAPPARCVPAPIAMQTDRFRSLSDNQLCFLLITPTILLLLFVVVYPLVSSLWWSFTDYTISSPDAKPAFIGVRNYADVLSDETMWLRFRTTAFIVVVSVGIQMLLGFGIALLLNREMRCRGLITTLLLTPMMLCPAVVGVFWRYIFDANAGLVNAALVSVGLKRIEWLSSDVPAMVAAIAVDVWMWTPFVMIISLAGLSAIPKYLYEAAEVDRASAWFKFRHITLPLVSPFLIVALLFRTMDTIKLFDMVWVLTKQDEPLLISAEIYKRAFSQADTGVACAAAYVVLVLVIAVSNVFIRYLNKVQLKS